MAIIKMKKLHELNDKDLNDKMKEIKLELSKEKGSSEIGTVKNPGRIRELRKTAARIMVERQNREKKSTKVRGGQK